MPEWAHKRKEHYPQGLQHAPFSALMPAQPVKSTGPPSYKGFGRKSPGEKLFCLYALSRQLSPDNLAGARELFSGGAFSLANTENFPESFARTLEVNGRGGYAPDRSNFIGRAGAYFDRLADGPQPENYRLLPEPIHFPAWDRRMIPLEDDYSRRARELFKDRTGEDCNSAPSYELIHRVLVGAMGSLRGERIVDFGCNIASYVNYISGEGIGAEGIGVDVNARLLAYANGEGVRVLDADPTKEAFPERFRSEFGKMKSSAVSMKGFIGSPGGATVQVREGQARMALANAHEILKVGGFCVIEPAIMYGMSIDLLLHMREMPARDEIEDLGFEIMRYGLNRGHLTGKSYAGDNLDGQLMLLLKKKK
ncbi:MAG: hypothetical protein V1875_06205 [Candidatus Altiarchaeota archaeon]